MEKDGGNTEEYFNTELLFSLILGKFTENTTLNEQYLLLNQ